MHSSNKKSNNRKHYPRDASASSAKRRHNVSSTLSNRSVATTPARRMAYGDPTPSVNSHGTSVFERLYQDAQTRSQRNQRLQQAQHEREYTSNYQTPQRTKQNHPQHSSQPFLTEDNVSTMSSLCTNEDSPSQSSRQRKPYKHPTPQQSYYHRSGWSCNFASSTRSVTSQDRRRFFQDTSSVSASVDGTSRSYASRFEQLYHNDYDCSASKHPHETPKNLSPSVSLERRNRYHPDKYPKTTKLSSARSVASASKIPSRPSKLHSYPHRSYTPQPSREQSTTTQGRSVATSSSSVPSRPRSAAKELAKWKQLQKEWFLDHISDDSEEEQHHRTQSRNGVMAHNHHVDDSSSSSDDSSTSRSSSQVERALLQNATPPHEQLDSTRELHWEELQRGWDHFAKNRATSKNTMSSSTPLSLATTPRQGSARVVSQSSQYSADTESRFSPSFVDAEQLFQTFEKMRRRRESFLSMKRTAGRLRAMWRHQRQSLPSSPLDYERRVNQVMEDRAALAIQSCWTLRAVRSRIAVDSYGDIVESATPLTPTESAHVVTRQEASAQLQATIGSLIQQAKKKSRGDEFIQRHDYPQFVDARMRSIGQEHAALLIQSRYRSHAAEQNYFRSLAAIILVQTTWRRHVAQRDFSRVRSAALSFQKIVRGVMVRQAIRQELEREQAATLIQACWRGYHIHEFVYWRLQVSIVRMQSWWRMVVSISHRRRLSEQRTNRDCAVRIQRQYRACAATRSFRKQRIASLVLQSIWRQWYHEKSFQRQRQSAIILQKHGRQMLALDLLRRSRVATLCIQSVIRMQQVRREFVVQKDGARRLQSFWRSCILQKRLAREEHDRMQHGVVLLQSITRGYLCRMKMICQFTAVTFIQSIWRRHLSLAKFRLSRNAAICMQSMARSSVQQSRYRKLRSAATMIQSMIRGAEARHHFSLCKASVLSIQTSARGFMARGRWQMQRAAAMALQAFWRGISCREQLLKNIFAAMKIQSLIRGLSARKTLLRYKQATEEVRQNAFERNKVEQRSAICLQTLIRCKQAQRKYVASRILVVRLQALVRGLVSRSKTRALVAALCDAIVERENESAVKIQSLWRANDAHTRFTRSRSAAIQIQSMVRMSRARAHLQLLKQNLISAMEAKKTAAAVSLQSKWRCSMLKECFHKKKSAVIKLQAFARLVCALSLAENLRSEAQQTNLLKDESATRIQSAYRKHKAHVLFKTVKAQRQKKIEEIQRKQQEAQDTQQKELSPEHHAAVILQATARRHIERQSFLRKKAAANRIRKYYILWKTKVLLLKFQCGSVLLRRGVEGRLPKCTSFALSQVNACLRSHMSSSLSADVALRIGYVWGLASSEARACAALVVQRYARGFTRRSSYNKIMASAQTIQRSFRGYAVRRNSSFSTRAQRETRSQKNDVRFADQVHILEDEQHVDESHQSTNTGLVSDESSSGDSLSMNSSERKVFAQGVETLQSFFEDTKESESERLDATNWFLSRLEMRSETEANLLLTEHSSNRACIDRLAERARMARAEIGADHVEPVLGVEGFLSPIKSE